MASSSAVPGQSRKAQYLDQLIYPGANVIFTGTKVKSCAAVRNHRGKAALQLEKKARRSACITTELSVTYSSKCGRNRAYLLDLLCLVLFKLQEVQNMRNSLEHRCCKPRAQHAIWTNRCRGGGDMRNLAWMRMSINHIPSLMCTNTMPYLQGGSVLEDVPCPSSSRGTQKCAPPAPAS